MFNSRAYAFSGLLHVKYMFIFLCTYTYIVMYISMSLSISISVYPYPYSHPFVWLTVLFTCHLYHGIWCISNEELIECLLKATLLSVIKGPRRVRLGVEGRKGFREGRA